MILASRSIIPHQYRTQPASSLGETLVMLDLRTPEACVGAGVITAPHRTAPLPREESCRGLA